MIDQYPITPPPELVRKWATASARTHGENGTYAQLEFALATQAARWGADQELEACCEWLHAWTQDKHPGGIENLRAHRRPKPPSLKQQALEALQRAEEGWRPIPDDCDTIRRALEQLDD